MTEELNATDEALSTNSDEVVNVEVTEGQQAEKKSTLADRIAAARDEIFVTMVSVNQEIRKANAELEGKKLELKHAKETLGHWHGRLSNLVDELEQVNRGQLGLPFGANGTSKEPATEEEDESVESGVDPATVASINQLDITKGQREKLSEAGLNTVADIESAMCNDSLRDVPGIGEAAVDRISDAVLEWREENGYSQPGEIVIEDGSVA